MLPFGAGDTAYEADKAYYLQSQRTAKQHQPPDLAIEIVVSHSEKKALRAGEFLRIPEIWVLDIPKHRLTFYHLAVTGKHKGVYRPRPRSRAFPLLTSAEILERLDDPETDEIAFHENCRAWARRVLVRVTARSSYPRQRFPKHMSDEIRAVRRQLGMFRVRFAAGATSDLRNVARCRLRAGESSA